ncbi:MAG: aromatic ring-hydroxylating dioxygenase subunit alpha [bacterium]|nr:aromatic ring-hydroxylating dioxygenase subunit alpha [bacterium]MDE0290627.1 aromatic ring-hydroxylating dioxygenase subunit alpha [bacterium]MDE0439080.1 aromatic ring-hydroxylating dioxygenase subunit alpha [bacterium]
MLSKEQNERLTRVGPGTPMGELLRRYWYPVAFVRELDEWPIRKVRLLGEDFALWKTPQGGYGIVQEACPHRAASLIYGVVEEDGLRCGYHGWKFDCSGNCIEQPAEPGKTAFMRHVKAFAGKAEALGGMVWAYIGPDPAPELPRFDVFVDPGFVDVGHSMLPCNWLQIMENSVDPHHVEWLHGRYFEFLGAQQGFVAPKSFQKKHLKVGFDAMEWGILKRRVLEGHTEEDDDWAVGHPLVFPHSMRVGGAGIDQMQIRVPIDDTTTWAMFYSNHHPEGLDTYPEQIYPVDYEYQWLDDKGRHIVDYIEGQDVMAWVSQGKIADRTSEHIGKSDIGVIMIRRMFKAQIARVEAGKDPTVAFTRVPQERIELPCEKKKFGAGIDFALAWLDMGSTRYSPALDTLRKIHLEAARARGEVPSSDEYAVRQPFDAGTPRTM